MEIFSNTVNADKHYHLQNKEENGIILIKIEGINVLMIPSKLRHHQTSNIQVNASIILYTLYLIVLS